MGASLRNGPHQHIVEADVRSPHLRVGEELHAHEPAGGLVLRLGDTFFVDEEAKLHDVTVAYALRA